MFSIKNKVIVVTGGNGLLGKQMVSSFRNQGALVIATGYAQVGIGTGEVNVNEK